MYTLLYTHVLQYSHVLQYTQWSDWCITRYPYHTLLHLYSQGHQGWAEGSQPRKAHIQHILHPTRYIYAAAIVTSCHIYISQSVTIVVLTSVLQLRATTNKQMQKTNKRCKRRNNQMQKRKQTMQKRRKKQIKKKKTNKCKKQTNDAKEETTKCRKTNKQMQKTNK